MISVRSYLRRPDGSFEPIETCATPPPDPDYIEGAIQLVIDDTEIVGTDQWDYVDQLWAYLATMVRELLTVGSAKTYFPDQPVMLRFVRHGDRVTVSSRVGTGPREATASLADFIVSLRDAGTIFFVRMSELEPLSELAYRAALRELNEEPPASAGGAGSG